MLEEVAVVGGGRWARVIVSTLADLLPQSTRLMVHTTRGADAMVRWVEAEAPRPVEVHTSWPAFRRPGTGAAIVANAAHDHEAVALRALQDGLHVLVEKPLTVDGESTRRLAAAGGNRLAAALVLRFAAHLRNYATLLAKRGGPRSIRIHWSDGAGESRYGEAKQFDASVPVVIDVLPHIVSILSAITTCEHPPRCEQVRIARGGAEVWLRLQLDTATCEVTLQRMADRRCRVVEVRDELGETRLDFSTEPGSIHIDGQTLHAAPDWGGANRPLPTMLRHFLDWAAGGARDLRLDVDTAMQASVLADEAHGQYEPQLIEWLLSPAGGADDRWQRYALSELLQKRGRLPGPQLEMRISAVRERLTGDGLSADELGNLLGIGPQKTVY
jgi:predicted dehydrogenase